ncbi:MAG: hypothetical protein HY034_00180 [Nitrospirae bacterium]|nr:hypothetical protein [Nitrospirota bacterium]
MKKKSMLFVLAVFLFFLITSLLLIPKANAIPAFARQTGQACAICHFQHFPELNAYGRAFKAGGYTQIGGQSLIEGEILSLPSTLNASLVAKVRYQKTNGKDNDGATGPTNGSKGTNKGELQFPDEAALLIGGRAGEHIGFLLEAGLTPGETKVTDSAGDTVTVTETNLFTSFKMPIVYGVGPVNLSVIPFTTDALGASYGFELLNTGAIAMQRVLEHAKWTTAQRYIGTTDADTAKAEGLAFHGATDFGPYMSYVRVAATPQFMGWDFGAGAQYWRGTGKSGGDTYTHADAWAIDAQAQGYVGLPFGIYKNTGLPVGVYLTLGDAKKSNAGGTANLFNSSTNKDKMAWSVLAELGVIPRKASVSVGYLAGQDRSASGATANNYKQNAITFGATYHLAQNVRLELDHSILGGNYYKLPANNREADGKQLTTLMLFAAF